MQRSAAHLQYLMWKVFIQIKFVTPQQGSSTSTSKTVVLEPLTLNIAFVSSYTVGFINQLPSSASLTIWNQAATSTNSAGSVYNGQWCHFQNIRGNTVSAVTLPPYLLWAANNTFININTVNISDNRAIVPSVMTMLMGNGLQHLWSKSITVISNANERVSELTLRLAWTGCWKIVRAIGIVKRDSENNLTPSLGWIE